MMNFRCLLLLLLLLAPLCSIAQQKDSVAFNQLDKKGKRNGMWYVQMPAQMGEDAFAEFGNYAHGQKVGKWYKFDDEGALLAEENYRYNMLDGEVKYFDRGRLTTIGHYRGLNPGQKYDTIIVIEPVTGEEMPRRISTEQGTVRHGIWQFYDPQTGRLIREEEYQVDELIKQKEFGITQSDSTYYKQREAAMPHNQKHFYKPPRGRNMSNTKF